MERGVESIESVLYSIGIRKGEPGVEELNLQEHLMHEDERFKTGVIFSKSEETYYLNCIVYGPITGDSFPGTMIVGSYRFSGLTLLGLSLIIEKGFKKYNMGIGFVENTRNDLVSYKLFPQEGEPKNKSILNSIRQMMKEIVTEQDNLYYGR